MSKVNIVVVGLGFGAAFVPIYQRHPNVGKVAICDADREKLTVIGDEFGVEDRFSSLDEALSAPSYQAVHVLTPVPSHADVTVQVLEAGKHCACAVPMATTLDDLARIVGAQRASGRHYMMMETSIYDRAFLYVSGLLERGEMGGLTFLQGTYFQDLEGDFPRYWRAVPPMHYATHSLSPLLALANTRATAVSCMGSGLLRPDIQVPGGNTFPLQSALFRLAGTPVIAQLNRSWFQLAHEDMEAFSVYGEKLSFEWQQILSEEPVLWRQQPVVAGQRYRPCLPERVTPPLRPDLYPTELAEFMEGWHGGSHPHLVHEFISSIVEDRQPRIDAVTAAQWTAAGICANDSSLLGGALVEIPDFLTA